MNATIARYISGVAIDAIIIGCLAFIGYSVIGLKYALVFAIFSGLANLIPYVGPSIGLIPMIIANVFTDPHRMLIASYLYAYYSTSGWEHPLPSNRWWSDEGSSNYDFSITFYYQVNIYGVIGMIVAVPTYSILKEISKFLSRLYENHK